MMMTRNTTGVRIASLLLATLLTGATAAGDAVTVEDAWARATPPGARTGAVYFVLDNPGPTDRLVGASTGAARQAQIHAHVHDGGMMTMEHRESLELPAGRTVFEPGGLHVMLIDLAGPLKAGDVIEVTLGFENAGDLVVDVAVEDARR